MKIIGHRGASGHVTENTLESFAKAYEAGCEMIELDVHLCKSYELVVFHDFSIKKMTGKDDLIGDLQWNEVREIILPDKLKIPMLKDVLDMFTEKEINIELKGDLTSMPVWGLLEHYKSLGRGPTLS